MPQVGSCLVCPGGDLAAVASTTPTSPRRTRKADGRCSLGRPELPLPTRPFTQPSERSFEVVTIVPILQMRTEI